MSRSSTDTLAVPFLTKEQGDVNVSVIVPRIPFSQVETTLQSHIPDRDMPVPDRIVSVWQVDARRSQSLKALRVDDSQTLRPSSTNSVPQRGTLILVRGGIVLHERAQELSPTVPIQCPW